MRICVAVAASQGGEVTEPLSTCALDWHPCESWWGEEIDELQPPRPPGLPPAVARPLCMSGFSTADLQGMERHEIAVARPKSNKL